MNFYRNIAIAFVLFMSSGVCHASDNVIEKQLQEIGSIPNEEVVVVQRKYTRKVMRSELTPISFGGVPFGTVRTTMFGGASYTLHLNDWFAIEPFEFLYSKNFFTSFTDDINNNKINQVAGHQTRCPAAHLSSHGRGPDHSVLRQNVDVLPLDCLRGTIHLA